MSRYDEPTPPKARAKSTHCPWCGTRLRFRRCPRGPQCERDMAEHNRIMRVIAAADKGRV